MRRTGGLLLAVAAIFAGWHPKPHAPDLTRPTAADRFWRELAVQDWVVLGYLVALVGCSIAGDGPRRATAIGYLTLDLGAFFGALVLARGKVLDGSAAALTYRAGLFAGVFGSFAHLQYVLPTARSTTLDAELHALDLAAFHVEPAQAFDRWVTPATTEWFSFFYFSYFFILLLHVVPFMFMPRAGRLLSEFSLGIVALFCIGQLLYILVPGHGPYHHLADRFDHQLDGPIWWPLVKATVDSVDMSARTDIFPSLHTAVPTFLAVFAFRHRRTAPFRQAWAPLALVASQIVLSTMFLRWHYLADVVAGLILALEVGVLVPRIVRWEGTLRARTGRAPVWTAPWHAPAEAGAGALATKH